MLPEFLYTVGSSSMQEFYRDDFSLLNGGTTNATNEKDMCHSLPKVNSSALVTVYDKNIPLPGRDVFSPSGTDTASMLNGIKLEDTGGDLFPTHASTWQEHPINAQEHAHHRLHREKAFNVGNSSKLLLQSSDDPLICRGANSVYNDDDHAVEFKSLFSVNGAHQTLPTAAGSPQLARLTQRASNNGCSSQTKQQLKAKAELMSTTHQHSQATVAPVTTATKVRTPKPKKKGAVKLRFHHQALPPEYLSHYEATQAQLAAPSTTKDLNKDARVVKITQTVKLPPPRSSHENVRSWLQKIAEIQRSAQQQHQHQHQHQQQQKQSALPQDPNNNRSHSNPPSGSQASAPAAVTPLITPVRESVVQQPSLPDAPPAPTKRVIKYTDLPYMGEITLDNSKPRRGRKPKKTDICHLIYKNYGTIFPGTPKEVLANTANKAKLQRSGSILEEQPLNLCLRDQAADLYSVSSGEDEDDETPASDTTSNCGTPVVSPLDAATDTLLAANMKIALPSPHTDECLRLPLPNFKHEPHASVKSDTATNAQLHSVRLYYQKLIECGLPIETIQKDNQLALKIPIPRGLLLSPLKVEGGYTVDAVSSSACVDYPEPLSTPSSAKSEHSHTTSATANSLPLAPQKRKRSAIFIPPMPADHTSNPGAEVSICKFKFTGGAKPTLQEKKMLSVDADGNYRYYSGTGDKSSRGYEFFPRESLQQSGLLPGVNCTGAFLHAAGERITADIPPPSADLSNELLQIPDSPNSELLLPTVSSPQVPLTPPCIISTPLPSTQTACATPSGLLPENYSNSSPQSFATNDFQRGSSSRCSERKKTRRSYQREKLEKTFKEKGFLIQTQQLESAEGATYCKFRQLKKFTRYLFRNWKDYLPNELQQANAAAAAAAAAAFSKAQSEAGDKNSSVPHQAALESLLASCGKAAVVTVPESSS